ncbi:hypothetical protein DFP73DRAFT_531929 [Morchella snyderi]|nr:hypothetical protein DFP73DRAFT_531929 [Morchella snyderi]
MSEDSYTNNPKRLTAWGHQFLLSDAEDRNLVGNVAENQVEDGRTKLTRSLNEGNIIAVKIYQAKNLNKAIIKDIIDLPNPNVVIHSRFSSISPDHIEVSQEPMVTTLGQLVSSPLKLYIEEVATICREILCGVEYLQQSHIVHGNLIPKNVLLNYHGAGKIGNFSTAFIAGCNVNNDVSRVGKLCIEMLQPGAHQLISMTSTDMKLCIGKSIDTVEFVADTRIPMLASQMVRHFSLTL